MLFNAKRPKLVKYFTQHDIVAAVRKTWPIWSRPFNRSSPNLLMTGRDALTVFDLALSNAEVITEISV